MSVELASGSCTLHVQHTLSSCVICALDECDLALRIKSTGSALTEELANMTRPIPKFKFGHGTIVVVVLLSRCSLLATLTPERSCILSNKLVMAPAENWQPMRGI